MNAKHFKKLGFESIHDLEKFLNRDDIKHMIGKEKYDHFRELWLSSYASSVMGEPKKKIEGKFNWLALIASPLVWYAYRRMYALVFSLCGVFAVLSFVKLFFDIDTIPGLMAVFLVLVFTSKNIYLGHLVRCTKKIDVMSSQEKIANFLKWRKSTSTGLAVLTTLFLAAVTAYVAVSMAERLMNELNSQMYSGESLYPEY